MTLPIKNDRDAPAVYGDALFVVGTGNIARFGCRWV